MTDETHDEELLRLREHNKQLLAELKTAKGEAKTAQEAATDALAARDDWKGRWYSREVLEPLEGDLRGAAAGPWKYLRDTAQELGLLKMEADHEGVDRPTWHTVDGKPADLSRGLHHFLSETYQADTERFAELGHSIRSSGTRGSGASASHPASDPSPSKPAEVHKDSALPFGLR